MLLFSQRKRPILTQLFHIYTTARIYIHSASGFVDTTLPEYGNWSGVIWHLRVALSLAVPEPSKPSYPTNHDAAQCAFKSLYLIHGLYTSIDP